jgi:hypothetical protein
MCGAAGLALLLAVGPATDRGASALTLASDAVVMPSATPLPAEPASIEPAADTAPAAEELFAPREDTTGDEAGTVEDTPPAEELSGPTVADAQPVEDVPPATDAQPAEDVPPTDELAEPTTAPEESPAVPDTPFVGPPQPEPDCADIPNRDFPDGDSIGC